MNDDLLLLLLALIPFWIMLTMLAALIVTVFLRRR